MANVHMDGPARCVAFAADDARVMCLAASGKIIVYDMDSASIALQLVTPRQNQWSLRFFPGGDRFLVCGASGHVQVRTYPDNALVVSFNDCGSALASAIHPDGERFVVEGKDTKIQLLCMTGEVEKTFVGHSGMIRTLAMLPAGDFFVSGSGDSRCAASQRHSLLLCVYSV